MRLNRAQLHDITGYKRQSAQAAWFARHLGKWRRAAQAAGAEVIPFRRSS